jgi:hypothetical protein
MVTPLAIMVKPLTIMVEPLPIYRCKSIYLELINQSITKEITY